MPFTPHPGVLLIASAAFLSGCKELVLLNPAGDIAAQQGQLVMLSTAIMLLIIVPVIGLTFLFAWRYRQGSRHAEEEYAPNWDHSTKLELVIWSVPLVIVIVLGAITWVTTHHLDPYRPLDRIAAGQPVPEHVKPLQIQVVSLDWKWLFIYPEQGIATVNEMAVPIDRPVHLLLTSSTTMNAFYVPDLAGMIYTMPGMQTELNGVINRPGIFGGLSSHYSGYGFSGMNFKLHSLDDADFENWIAKARNAGLPLTRQVYSDLVRPTERHPVTRFSTVEAGLYDRVLNLCVEEGQPCMHEVMARDARRNRDHAARQLPAGEPAPHSTEQHSPTRKH